MPKTKMQGWAFRILMALVMVWGMEVYNHLFLAKITARSFMVPVLELLPMMCIVMLLQEFIAGRLAGNIASRVVKVQQPFVRMLAMQICTVCIMCPMMSLVVTLMFKSGVPAPLPVKWLQTLAVNLPMAMAWQLLAAGPLVRRVVKRISW